MTVEHDRLNETLQQKTPWKKWGPYLSERQWGTVREDYSENGDAWNFFTHDQARSRAYRWGEDGLAGISDDQQQLCFALALWNGKDPILKERLFGLTNSEGNHGEDVKEYYFYLDSTPTHSYMKYLYKYPQAAFPYADLLETNRRRNRNDMEYELLDTGVFQDDRYFDVFVEYAKAGPEDILVRITAANRGPDAADLHLLPTLWFRNDWSRGSPNRTEPARNQISNRSRARQAQALSRERIRCSANSRCTAKARRRCSSPRMKRTTSGCSPDSQRTRALRQGWHQRLRGPGPSAYAVNPAKQGTKVAAHYHVNVGAGQTTVIRLRLSKAAPERKCEPFGKPFDQVLR